MSAKHKIIYTLTDEAPALATYSFLPIVKAFAAQANVAVETRDISLAARILAQFPEFLQAEQQVPDSLAELGKMTQDPTCNIIKLPNISASLPQLKAAIAELQEQGYALPHYPENPQNDTEREIQKRYGRVSGSAVNPVLREGNSDRRAPKAVKNYARKHPHKMGAWSTDSQSKVASMEEGDFYGSEKSLTLPNAEKVSIVLKKENGEEQVLKADLALQAGEVIDAAVLSRQALRDYIAAQIAAAKERGVLFSVHLKATMMKVSDPIIFGHFVEVYFASLFEKYGERLRKLGWSPRSGLSALHQALDHLPEGEKAAVLQELEKCYATGPDLAMVNSDKGITNLHMPNDVIIDASMPAMIRSSGQMWNKNNQTQDTLACIPDRSYAGVYQETIAFCKQNGAFDPTTMGSVSNVGLMAQKAEEYGSHDKTFEIAESGSVEVRDEQGRVLLSHSVAAGDIWRMCQTKDAPIRDWVKLAVRRARETGQPAIFWLDEKRAHDKELRAKVKTYLAEANTEGLQIEVMNPEAATRFSLERLKAGEDTISVTGNVLRDYLTDLFPILEVGTSAKMLSIVPLMCGGGLFETGAGGSAPKHVQQFLKENHLRWDSLGEFLALAASLEHLGRNSNTDRALVLAETLDEATSRYLEENRSPSRKVNEPDNRSSHFYLGLYWAQALAAQKKDRKLQERFAAFAQKISREEENISRELLDAQGKAIDLGGYFYPDGTMAETAMRPSKILNQILTELS